MTAIDLCTLLGGTALFLYGMRALGNGLQAAAGENLRTILGRLAKTRLRGFLLGLSGTALIQSSAASTAMLIGFIDAKMLPLRAGVPVILGSTVGTTMTGWLLTLGTLPDTGWTRFLSPAMLCSATAIAGTVLLFSRKPAKKAFGEVLSGFAVLLCGMQIIGRAAGALQGDARFVFIARLCKRPLPGLLAGTALTALIQSASAGVGLVQTLCGVLPLPLHTCVPLLLGINLGASTPVLLAGAAAARDGRRAAVSYLLFELLSIGIIGMLYYPLRTTGLFAALQQEATAVSVAVLNSLLRLVCAAALLPLTDKITRLTGIVCRPRQAGSPAPHTTAKPQVLS